MDTPNQKPRDINSKHLAHLRPPNPKHKDSGLRWTVQIIIWSFIISTAINYSSTEMLKRIPFWAAFVVLFVIIFINIFFDIIGVAVAAASEKPFHAIASRRVDAARYAILLIRNAEKVSNLCADVIGDITGILSGTLAVLIVANLSEHLSQSEIFLTLFVGGLVASLTVGGKAFGKKIAIAQCNGIIFSTAKALMWVERLLGIKRDFNNKKKGK